MNARRRAPQAAMAALLLLAVVAAPSPSDATPSPSNPLVNGDFEVGSPITVDTATWPIGEVLSEAGSVLPGVIENRALVAVAGWTIHVFSGLESPHSTARWAHGVGMPLPVVGQNPTLGNLVQSAALEITYDERDHGAETLVLHQAMGQEPHAGLFANPDAVGFQARTVFGHPLYAMGAVTTVEHPFTLAFTAVGVVDSTAYEEYVLAFDAAAGTVTGFLLFLWGDLGQSQDTTLYLDDVELIGADFRPEFEPGGGILEPWRREVCRLTEVCV